MAREAAELLRDTGLHGREYAIDAMVAVTRSTNRAARW